MIKSLRKYPHAVRERTRHGRECYYFRRAHGPRIRIHATLGTEEFDQRYNELLRPRATGSLKQYDQPELAAHAVSALKQKSLSRFRPVPNTLRWLGTQYMASTKFSELDPRTQYVTRQILDSIFLEPIAPGAKEVFGDCP